MTTGTTRRRLALAGAALAAALPSSLSSVVGPLAASPVAGPSSVSFGPSAKNLAITGSVVVELVDADAAFKHLAPDDFVGVRAAYYAYNFATSTYWAAAQVVPSSSSYRAEVSSQDDGGYTVFHEPPRGRWVAVDDGMGGEGCSNYHVSIPAAVLAVWHWPARRCTPPDASGGLLLTYYARARQLWREGANAISARQAVYWLGAAKDLDAAVTGGAPGTRGYSKAALELVELSRLPDAMQTQAQSKRYSALTASLNSFFGTDHLYASAALIRVRHRAA